MNIIAKSGNLSAAKMYNLTKSPEVQKLSNCAGQTLDLETWLIYEDVDSRGEIRQVMAMSTPENESYATNSKTFIADFMNIVSMFTEAGEPIPTRISVVRTTLMRVGIGSPASVNIETMFMKSAMNVLLFVA